MAIDKSLKMDLPALAEMLRSKGRGKDTILAHITPKEAALLKRRGGSGTINPETGLPEFADGEDYFAGLSESAPVDTSYSQAAAPVTTTPTDTTAPTVTTGAGGGAPQMPPRPPAQMMQPSMGM